MYSRVLLGILVGFGFLSACESTLNKLEQVGEQPVMSAADLPMQRSTYRPLRWVDKMDLSEDKGREHANSLWRPHNRSFFKDQRARRVGDILKVVVKIQDKAELDNETLRERSGKEDMGAKSLFGLQNLLTGWLPGKAVPNDLLDISTTSKNQGKGEIDREEKIETEVAAIVTQILPNGNLVVHGDQEVRVNYEIRQISISGIVRPEDISADNTVQSNQIASARISYGGRGHIMEVQQPRIGSQIVDVLSPF